MKYWNSRSFNELLNQIPKLSRPDSVFKYFPGPGKIDNFFKDFQGSMATLLTFSEWLTCWRSAFLESALRHTSSSLHPTTRHVLRTRLSSVVLLSDVRYCAASSVVAAWVDQANLWHAYSCKVLHLTHISRWLNHTQAYIQCHSGLMTMMHIWITHSETQRAWVS